MRSDDYYRKSSKQNNSLKIGLIVGLVWAVLQFAASETLYQLALMSDNQVLFDASDAVAWPAGHFYHDAEINLLREELGKLEASNEEREEWNTLLLQAEDINNSEAYDAIWEILDAHSREPYIEMSTEYTIYVGVCVAWGFAAGFLVIAVQFIRAGI